MDFQEKSQLYLVFSSFLVKTPGNDLNIVSSMQASENLCTFVPANLEFLFKISLSSVRTLQTQQACDQIDQNDRIMK